MDQKILLILSMLDLFSLWFCGHLFFFSFLYRMGPFFFYLFNLLISDKCFPTLLKFSYKSFLMPAWYSRLEKVKALEPSWSGIKFQLCHFLVT